MSPGGCRGRAEGLRKAPPRPMPRSAPSRSDLSSRGFQERRQVIERPEFARTDDIRLHRNARPVRAGNGVCDPDAACAAPGWRPHLAYPLRPVVLCRQHEFWTAASGNAHQFPVQNCEHCRIVAVPRQQPRYRCHADRFPVPECGDSRRYRWEVSPLGVTVPASNQFKRVGLLRGCRLRPGDHHTVR